MYTITTDRPNLKIVSINLRRLEASSAVVMQSFCRKKNPQPATLFDLGKVRSIAASGIGALIEVAQNNPNVGFCAPNPATAGQLTKLGLHRALRIFATQEAALNSPWIKGQQLAGTKAVILAAGKGSRCAPLTQTLPKPMMPVFGRPIIEHLLAHLGKFGLSDVIINPGYQGPKIIDHLRSGSDFGHRIHYASEGRSVQGIWRDDPLGSGTTLRRLHFENSAFFDDFFVFCGDALIDIDLAAMMEQHRSSGALMTIAAQRIEPSRVEKFGIIGCTPHNRITAFQEKPTSRIACSNLANTGIYIVSPEILGTIPEVSMCDIGTHLIPKLLAEGANLQVFQQPFTWLDVGCPRDLFTANVACLQGKVPFLRAGAPERKSEIWASESAEIHPQAEIQGPIMIGKNVQIERDAKLVGPVIIGDDCEINTGSLVRNSFIWPDTIIGKGALVDGMIASGDWAFAHEYALKAVFDPAPLDFVRPKYTPQTEALPKPAYTLRAVG